MKRTFLPKWSLFFFIAGAVLMTSCMDLSMNSENFTNEEVNDFRIVKAGLNNTTQVEYHEYICSDDTNHILVSGPVDDGLIAITITDDQDNIVFNRKLSGFTVFDEDIYGVSGIWTVKLDYQKARGSIDLRLTNQ